MRPRQKMINAKNFEFYPKGTTCLISNKENLLKGYKDIVSYSKDLRMANDDTLLLKNMAGQSGIVISPQYRSWYTPRGSFNEFLTHTFHRGQVFADGHVFNLSIWGATFLGFSLIVSYLTLLSPDVISLQFTLILLGVTVAVSVCARFSPRHFVSFLLLTPIFISSYSAGVITGTLRILRNCRITARRF